MKVFISWSGERSKAVAEILRGWIKCVIQSIEPFVSSEDIQRGARWFSNVSQELQDTNFGIICITKDNYNAPWLLFEAGALSKTMADAHVVPFLFDLKLSDMLESPFQHFQASICLEEDIKKLMVTLNSECSPKLSDSELDEAFETWYPKLDKKLKEIPSTVSENDDNTEGEGIEKTSLVLEEILALSKDNQKQIINAENRTMVELEQVNTKLEYIFDQSERSGDYLHGLHVEYPAIFEKLLLFSRNQMDDYYRFLFVLSLFKEYFPWVYYYGKEILDILKSSVLSAEKERAIQNFKNILESSRYIVKRSGDVFHVKLFRELLDILMDELDKLDQGIKSVVPAHLESVASKAADCEVED